MMGVVVYKIGGSLFEVPDLGGRIVRLLNGRADSHPLLIAGGGRAADLVREWDGLHHLGEETAHWLAMRAMMLGEELLTEIIPRAVAVADRNGAQAAWGSRQIPILRAREFVAGEEQIHGEPLPHTWEITSDSIAAWVARCWPAEELVLCKSADINSHAVRDGDWVDAYFRVAALGLSRVNCINLRSDSPQMFPLERNFDF